MDWYPSYGQTQTLKFAIVLIDADKFHTNLFLLLAFFFFSTFLILLATCRLIGNSAFKHHTKSILDMTHAYADFDT